MLDIKWIRKNPKDFTRAMNNRGEYAKLFEWESFDNARRDLIQKIEKREHQRKQLTKQVEQAKAQNDLEQVEIFSKQVKKIKRDLRDWEEKKRNAIKILQKYLDSFPNIPLSDVPVGEDENDNIEQYWDGKGMPKKPTFNFMPLDHTDIGKGLGMMDFSTAAKLSGARFVVLRGALARLERALASFMLDIHTEKFGYQEVVPPFLVREKCMYGTAQLPKFEDDQFSTFLSKNKIPWENKGEPESGLWLIPTAEVPLTNLAREHVFEEKELPLRFTAATPCFRKEAGAAGRDTRGMIRQHQFSKVELVSVVRPVDSPNELKRMLGCAEEVLKRLELHYRVVLLCTGDMGFAASKTYDIEVWLPGEDKYREISSCSSCGDFQARRMKARYRRNYDRRIETVHTLNGSGVALGRALLALLEQKQCADGSVLIPEALRPYMGGMERIERRDP
ncbi:MAG: serine--tRNA ligase [Hyphomicrobiales bacterium]|nr:serine--tRNA ligase [Hyphomicrobiales bacterium]